MNFKQIGKLIGTIVLSEGAGVIGSFFTKSSLVEWYPSLRKPSWTPPDWVFGPVWLALYLLMGVAAFLVWREGTDRDGVVAALTVFCVQLALNVMWSVLFFGMHETGLAFILIVVLCFMILFTILLFYRVSRLAAYLLIPYLAWTLFASSLNVWIFVMNG